MKNITLRWDSAAGWSRSLADINERVDLILYFGASEVLARADAPWRQLHQAFPKALCAGCSSAGEILNDTVADDGLSAVLIQFSTTKVVGVCLPVTSASESAAVGAELAKRLVAPGLRHVLVLSDGLGVNGTSLTEGLRKALPEGVQATGGLAGDGARFKTTLVGLGGDAGSGRVVGVGFYGDKLKVSHGSAGGWQAFGPTRKITGATGNVLHTLDGQPALAIYKRYLGDLAAGLPATGLLFPLELKATAEAKSGLVRTILAVDEATQSLTFAGDMPVGSFACLMKASCDALVGGAESAAGLAHSADAGEKLAVMVSCVGRKLVMNQRVEEEVEAVLESLGAGVSAAGFYSYGEICPSGLTHGCELHNQTMTLTVFSEEAA